jgi:hypothetical protein
MDILIYEYGFLVCVIGTDPHLLSIYKKEKKTLLLKELRNNKKILTHLSGGSSGQ